MHKTIINVETGEISEIELTAEEIAQRQIDETIALSEKQAEQAVKAQRQALLAKLGITEEEAKILLS